MYHVVQVYHTVLMFVQNSKSTMEHGTHGQGTHTRLLQDCRQYFYYYFSKVTLALNLHSQR